MNSTDVKERAAQYAKKKSLQLSDILGFGIDGTVWRTTKTAVKVFERDINYFCESGCYQRLQEFGVSQIEGLEVPQLVDCDDELNALEMTIVRPPYLLDFGKAWLDRPPNYSREDKAMWESQHREWWGDDWPRVALILWILSEKYGIYYNDPKPGNLVLTPTGAT